ncbi:MAG: hypothetical protein AB7U93_05150 [Deferribacterales bacterium]
MSKRVLLFLMAVLACTVLVAGCGGDDGSDGTSVSVDDVINSPEFQDAIGDNTDALSKVASESCAVCHNDSAEFNGTSHQNKYDTVDTDAYALTVTNVALGAGSDADHAVVTVDFTFTDGGNPVVLADLPSLAFGVQKYPNGSGYGIAAAQDTLVDNGGGSFTFTSTDATAIPSATADYFVYASATANEVVMADQPAAAQFHFYETIVTGGKGAGTLDVGVYSSTASASGCVRCHGDANGNYKKHGYIEAAAVDSNDFVLCYKCHYLPTAGTNGGHQSWQLLVDNPQKYAEYALLAEAAGDDVEDHMTAAELTKYAYNKTLMNDVHMSHAKEFAYPQSMANCATCHTTPAQRTAVLDMANFTYATCISCHPQNGGTDTANADGDFAVDTTEWSLQGLADASAYPHGDLSAIASCAGQCHGATAPSFSTIHNGGFDKAIYTSAGVKYADDVVVTIDSASVDGTNLTINFSAASTVTGLEADIVPSVYVAGYGYDTKDFIVSNHTRDADRNYLGEYTFGGTSPYFSNATQTGATWSVVYDLTALDGDGYITDGVVRNLEIAIAPALTVDGVSVGMNAPSKTFSLTTGAFVDDYYQGANAIVSEANGCNTCHDQLATTFHSPNRGGNIVVCRMCHVVGSGGSHLEMQSRSIDSYVHATHTFQPYDTDDVDFTDPVEAVRYEHHVESTYPMFTTTNCESCHTSGTYAMPDESKSLPGRLSAAYEVGVDRSIGAVPAYVTGAVSRACGSCHRAEMINEDEAGELSAFNAHAATFGYMVEDDGTVLADVIEKIMTVYK